MPFLLGFFVQISKMYLTFAVPSFIIDLGVLISDGFIDKDPSSKNFWNFTVSAEKLNLYDADGGLGKKLADLKANATKSKTSDEKICIKVMEELFSACNPDVSTCSNPNGQSFAVSTDQVCDAVNTLPKLLFEAIGDEFDGFVDKHTFCELYLSLFCAIWLCLVSDF